MSMARGTLQQGVENKFIYNTGMSGDAPKKSDEDQRLTKRLRRYAAIGYTLLLEGSVAMYSALRNYTINVPEFFKQVNPELLQYGQFCHYTNVQMQDGILLGLGFGASFVGMGLAFSIWIGNIEAIASRKMGDLRRNAKAAVISLLLVLGLTPGGMALVESEQNRRQNDAAAALAQVPTWPAQTHNALSGSLSWAFSLGTVTGLGLGATFAGAVISYLAYETYQQRKMLRKRERLLFEGIGETTAKP